MSLLLHKKQSTIRVSWTTVPLVEETRKLNLSSAFLQPITSYEYARSLFFCISIYWGQMYIKILVISMRRIWLSFWTNDPPRIGSEFFFVTSHYRLYTKVICNFYLKNGSTYKNIHTKFVDKFLLYNFGDKCKDDRRESKVDILKQLKYFKSCEITFVLPE